MKFDRFTPANRMHKLLVPIWNLFEIISRWALLTTVPPRHCLLFVEEETYFHDFFQTRDCSAAKIPESAGGDLSIHIHGMFILSAKAPTLPTSGQSMNKRLQLPIFLPRNLTILFANVLPFLPLICDCLIFTCSQFTSDSGWSGPSARTLYPPAVNRFRSSVWVVEQKSELKCRVVHQVMFNLKPLN